ncbi:glycoside hydrolase family 7 protein [Chaetomium strumarium]|uniref:Glucanase n=1 Tax=Chaetomium strumarium TaxID=1170767 RepID=A0AAJ0GN78_9PEZI|nr:glycoside hydrolase family 7 protein [Chaetomium strumarium]
MGQKKTFQRLAATALAVLPFVNGQQPGSSTPEVHPKLATWKCTTSGGCVEQQTSVVLDWNYRWIHTANGSTSCTASGGVDKTLCPDEATCAQNCVVEGADYASAGIATSGSSLTLRQYVKGSNGQMSSVSPRAYLLGPDGNYEMLKLLGQELSFDVDLSTLPCGENGALYLSEMDMTGGRNEYNTGGANYGSGYCDAQCPVQTWTNGTLNTSGQGYCCNEMDILEANARANAFTPHPCANGGCDKSGCGFNPYARGYTSYYGPGMAVDTARPFTVVTQFATSDGTTAGSLSQITRYYVQDGKKIASAAPGGDTITAAGCTSAASWGGLAGMGQALGRGMVLTFSVWNDAAGYMNWLDSGSNGPCSSSEGNPADIAAKYPDTHVVFSNIRWGDIGSTVPISGGGGSSSSSSTKPASTSTSTSTSTTTKPSQPAQTHYGQCGGNGWTGPTQCQSPYTCKKQNDWYSQCL